MMSASQSKMPVSVEVGGVVRLGSGITIAPVYFENGALIILDMIE